MSIYHDLVMMVANEAKRTNEPQRGWAVRGPDRSRGYWNHRLQQTIIRKLRYQRMCRRRVRPEKT